MSEDEDWERAEEMEMMELAHAEDLEQAVAAAEQAGFERGVREALDIALKDEPVEWECAEPLHRPATSHGVPVDWVCEQCGSSWWDMHEGVKSMPEEYQTAARIRSLLPGAPEKGERE